MNLNRKFSKACSLLVIFQLILNTEIAFATTNDTDPMNINANALTPLGVNCDSTCSLLMKNSGHLVGIQTSDWTTDDDQYCANHGSVTNVAVGPASGSSCTAPAFYCATASLSSACNVPMSSSDVSCTQANQNLLHCKLKNSQAESYCQSYVQTKDANKYNYAALAVDGAVVISCAAACVAEEFPGGQLASAACTILDVGATVTEMVATSKLQSSDVMKTVSYAAASVGFLSGAASGVKTGAKAFANVANKLAGVETVKSTSKIKNGMACLTAVLYTALLIIRGVNIGNVESTHSSSCSSLQTLISNASSSSSNSPDITYSSSTPTSTPGAGVNSLGSGTSSNTPLTSSTGGSGGGSGSGAGGGTPVWTACSSGSGLCLNPEAATAGDTAPVAKAGADSKLSSLANKIQPQLAQQAATGASGSQMVSGLLGSPGADSGFGKLLGKFADEVKKNPEDFSAMFPSGAIFKGMGRGFAKTEKEPDADPFGSFNTAPNPTAGTGELSFSKQKALVASSDGDDIYHAGWPGTLFDITTTRLRKALDRVEQLEWDTPLNRALNGLARKK